jgi:hypothetical protein
VGLALDRSYKILVVKPLRKQPIGKVVVIQSVILKWILGEEVVGMEAGW